MHTLSILYVFEEAQQIGHILLIGCLWRMGFAVALADVLEKQSIAALRLQKMKELFVAARVIFGLSLFGFCKLLESFRLLSLFFLFWLFLDYVGFVCQFVRGLYFD